MNEHFSGHEDSECTRAINKHGREKFVCVMLLAGIDEPEDRDSAEVQVIKHLAGQEDYNIQAGGRGTHMINPARVVVITILDTGAEIHFRSLRKAARGMGVMADAISRLANNAYKRAKKRKCKGGKYMNKYFTARFAIG